MRPELEPVSEPRESPVTASQRKDEGGRFSGHRRVAPPVVLKNLYCREKRHVYGALAESSSILLRLLLWLTLCVLVLLSGVFTYAYPARLSVQLPPMVRASAIFTSPSHA